MVEYIKNNIIETFDENHLENILRAYDNEATLINENTERVLKYLSSKYEVVALSNWYYDTQVNRLKISGIYKYFTEVFTLDNAGAKPEKKTYEKACYPHSYEECIIIGDNIEHDIIEPNKLGMKTIYFNEDNNTEFKTIKSIEELERIL